MAQDSPNPPPGAVDPGALLAQQLTGQYNPNALSNQLTQQYLQRFGSNPIPNAGYPGMLAPGNIINLYNRPVTSPVATPQGLPTGEWLPPGWRPTSTTYSATMTKEDDPRLAQYLSSYGPDAAVLLPMVVNGQFLTKGQAVDRLLTSGEHLGIFDRWQSAEPYATQLHNSQFHMGDFFGKTSTLAPQPPPK